MVALTAVLKMLMKKDERLWRAASPTNPVSHPVRIVLEIAANTTMSNENRRWVIASSLQKPQ